ncbi:MAG: acyltransferase family protein [Ilumatobacteraceae bacterium]
MTEPWSAAGRRGIAHHPGLDGLRGLAVALVVLFHADLPWMSGGFLGVSVFFTLSGFLITSLLLNESEQQGSIDLRAFWSRRLRRLAPASLAVIVAVVGLASWLSTTTEAARIEGDAVSAALYASNWRFIVAEHSYADLFSAPSPLLHIWSLSIEEQLYVVLPVIVAATLAVGWTRRRLGILLGVLALASTMVGIAVSGVDRVYYGTDTRAAELLLGAVLACLAGGRLGEGATSRAERTLKVLGPVALTVLVALAVTSEPRSTWIAGGGLAIFALVSVLLVVASIVRGPIRTILSWSPLRALGRVSYGVYLVHWPVFVFLTEDRLGVGGVVRLTVCIASTVLVAAASHRWFERPVRDGRLFTTPIRAASAFVIGVSASVVLPLVVLAEGETIPGTAPTVLVTTTLATPSEGIPDATSVEGEPDSETGDSPSDDAPVTALVLGDSTANNLARALADVADPGFGVVDAGVIGCPLVPAVRVFDQPGESRDTTYCPVPSNTVRESLEWTPVDLVLVVVGPPSRWAYENAAGEIVEPSTDAYVDDLNRTMDALVAAAGGRPLIVFDAPYVRDDERVLGDDPVLVDLWNAVVDEWDARDEVAVYRYSKLFAPAGSDIDREQRPDGVHFDREFAEQLARDIVIPELRAMLAEFTPR